MLKGIIHKTVNYLLVFALVGCSSNQIPDPITKLATMDDIIKGNYIAEVDEFLITDIETIYQLPKKNDYLLIDVRSKDISKIKMSENEWNEVKESLLFNNETIWPYDLPNGFKPKDILEESKHPALNISKIHKQGIKGNDISVAIIDGPLHIEHEEICDSIITYQKNNVYENYGSHGLLVSSVLAGKTVGVAPNSNIHYFASEPIKFVNGEKQVTFKPYVECIDHIIEMNKYLENPIRVISISIGFSKTEDEDSKEFYYAIEKAKKNNIEVFTTTTIENYKYGISGVKCDSGKNRDDYSNYYEVYPKSLSSYEKRIGVPCGGITVADMYGKHNYSYTETCGMSYSVPWLAGLYALCLEISPTISADEFLDLAYETGFEMNNNYLTHIINPENLLKRIIKDNSEY